MKKFSVILAIVLSSIFVSAAPNVRLLYECGVLKNSEGIASKSAPFLSIVENRASEILVKAKSLRDVKYEKLLMRAGGAGLQIRESQNYRFVINTGRPSGRTDGASHMIYSKLNSDLKASCKGSR